MPSPAIGAAEASGRWLRPSGALLLLSLVAACATATTPPDTLLPALQRHYAIHAVEENGACPSPELASIMQRKVVSASGERTVLRVRYSYVDPSVEEGTDWDRVLIRERRCTGVGERDFTLVERRTGYGVVEMSGEQR